MDVTMNVTMDVTMNVIEKRPVPYWMSLYLYGERKPYGFPVLNMPVIEQFILHRGVLAIRKIIIKFLPKKTQPGWLDLFPHGIHNIVLVRSPAYPIQFHVQFFHYMNPFNHHIILPIEQQVADYCALTMMIYQSSILTPILASIILYPFPTDLNNMI
jgi:hypothetical protein